MTTFKHELRSFTMDLAALLDQLKLSLAARGGLPDDKTELLYLVDSVTSRATEAYDTLYELSKDDT